MDYLNHRKLSLNSTVATKSFLIIKISYKSKGNYRIESIYPNGVKPVSATSVGAVFGNKLLIGTVFESKILLGQMKK